MGSVAREITGISSEWRLLEISPNPWVIFISVVSIEQRRRLCLADCSHSTGICWAMANTWGWMCRPQHSTIKLITRNTLSYNMADPQSSVKYTNQWLHLSVTLLNISQQLQQVRYHVWYELNDNNYMKSTVPTLLLYAHTYRGKIFSCEGKIIYSWCVLSRSPVLSMYNNTWI